MWAFGTTRWQPTLAVAGALTPGCKVEGLTHGQGCIVLVSLLHITGTPFHKEVIEGLAIVQYLALHLKAGCAFVIIVRQDKLAPHHATARYSWTERVDSRLQLQAAAL